MKRTVGPKFWAGSIALITLFTAAFFVAAAIAEEHDNNNDYLQTNLVSDVPGLAMHHDAALVNSWGLVSSPGGSPWWVADNATGLSTLYDASGTRIPLGCSPQQPADSGCGVIIPPPSGASGPAAPTGVIFNPTKDFVVSAGGNSGVPLFIFATEDGTISGWSPVVNRNMAALAVDNPNTISGPVYKGLALANNGGANFLYATNFRFGVVDVFNSSFTKVMSFTDADLPAGYAPFGIAKFTKDNQDLLFVTYALQDDLKHDDVAGPGHGFVDVFYANGQRKQRLISRGKLNSPWGLAMAPSSFGAFSNDLLVGNFGNGKINGYDSHGEWEGQLHQRGTGPITIDGLWALSFGNGGTAGPTTTLFFTAGPDHESHGLLGSITAVPPHTGDKD